MEAERSALAQAVLGVEVGDIVVFETGGKLVRMAMTGVALYSTDKSVTFSLRGMRFRKDGMLGKREDWFNIVFEQAASQRAG